MTSILDYFKATGHIAAKGGRYAKKGLTYTGKSITHQSNTHYKKHANQRRL